MKNISKLLKKDKLIRIVIILSVLGGLVFASGVLLVLVALPLKPKYELAPGEMQMTPGVYNINPQNGLEFSDVKLDESILGIGTPEKLEVRLFYKARPIGEKPLDLGEIRLNKEKGGKYAFYIPFNNFTLDESDTEQFIEVNLTSSGNNTEYMTKRMKINLDLQNPAITSHEAAPGGIEVKATDIYVYTNVNQKQTIKIEFNEPVELSFIGDSPRSYDGIGKKHILEAYTFGEGQMKSEFEYVAKDAAGNITKGRLIRTLDSDGPEINLESRSTKSIGGTTSSTGSLKFSSNETLKSIKYDDNETTVAQSDGTYNVAGFRLVPGVNTFEVIAMDLAGNESRTIIKVTATTSSSQPLSSSDKCTIADTTYCMKKVGGNPCNNPSVYISCEKSRCDGAISLVCGGKTYKG